MEKRQWLGSKTVNRNQIANRAGHRDGQTSHADGMTNPDRLAEVQAVAAQLTATGQRISRHVLRRAGIHGSNADSGLIACIVKPRRRRPRRAVPGCETQTDGPVPAAPNRVTLHGAPWPGQAVSS